MTLWLPTAPAPTRSAPSSSQGSQSTYIKEQKLHNLLRWLPGFEASHVNFKGEEPMGFALFSSAHHAIAAKVAL
ncbi:hypothetical protein GUJ93_ZPchr0010g7837 [Zizania palustris]|uniref:Uncharacterized protein n=1 Tax=Zizania palustris TaxID=103762 RepID=A0A8J5WCJ9_ZIZPA|nr:hypothetical protein GUJ93_ZPchr0010g7837 [Zizania palustris]